jgi:hypothetical protein
MDAKRAAIGTTNFMASDLESAHLTPAVEPHEAKSRWVKVGFVAVASALAGGLAAAWWYRKTLASLQDAEEAADHPHFRILDE